MVLAWGECLTLIDVDIASLSFKPGARTVTFVTIDQVLTSPVIFAGSASTLIYVYFTEFALKPGETLTVIALKNVGISYDLVFDSLKLLTKDEKSELHVPPFLHVTEYFSQKLI